MDKNSLPAEFQRFPSTWEVLPFSSAVEDRTGGNPKVKQSVYQKNGNLAVVDQGQSLIAGYVNDVTLACKERLPCIIFGDHTRIFKYIEEPFALGADGVKVLVPTDGFDKRFLFHYLKQVRLPENAGYSRHFKFLKDAFIPKPSLKEQQRITAILDKADSILCKRQQAIKLADEFLRSAFLEMFGDPMMNTKAWPTLSLGQVAPPTPVRGVTVSNDDNVWLLNLDNIESNTGRILAEYKCKYGDVGNSTHWFDQSHVLYSKLRPYLNKVVLPLSAGIATSELLPLKPNPAIVNREYLAYFLRSDSFLKWANSKVAGAKMPRLSPSELQNLSIPIPPMDIQNNFRNIVNQVTTFKSKLETFGIQNENLFNALSQKAFAGEL